MGALQLRAADRLFGGDREVLRYAIDGRRLFDVRVGSAGPGRRSRSGSPSACARGPAWRSSSRSRCFIIGVWRGTRSLAQRVGGAGASGFACTALVPLNQYSNLTRLFDPAVYFTPKGGPLTGNAGALATTERARAARHSRRVPAARAAGAALGAVGDRAAGRRGSGRSCCASWRAACQIPAHGVDSSLWLIWEIPLFLAAVPVLLAGAAAGASLLGPRRGVPPWVAPLAAARRGGDRAGRVGRTGALAVVVHDPLGGGDRRCSR